MNPDVTRYLTITLKLHQVSDLKALQTVLDFLTDLRGFLEASDGQTSARPGYSRSATRQKWSQLCPEKEH